MIVFRSVKNQNEANLSVNTDLNEESLAEFRGALYAELDQPESRVMLDLSRVRSINSAALGAILLVQKRARECGKEIVIGQCSKELRATLLAIRLDRIIEVQASEGPSLESKPGSPPGVFER